MKIVILLLGMAAIAWLVATQLKTSRETIPGGPSGTPQQILDQTREKAKKIEADAQKRADQSGAAEAESH